MRKSFLGSDLLDFIGVFSIEQHDFLSEVLFDVATDAHRLIRVHQVDGDAVLAEASGSSDSVQISLAVGAALLIHRKVEVHDDVDLIDVDAAR